MDTVIDDLLRRPGPGRRSIAGARDTRSAYSPDPSQWLREGASFEEACSSLTKDQPREWFWGLYCCDSANCGVYIEPSPITWTKSIGYDNIYDPGPPQTTCGNSTPFLIPLNVDPSTSTTSSASASVLSVSTTTPSTPQPGAATPTTTADTSTTTETSSTAIPPKTNRLSSGAKAAIGVCAALATISLAIALFFMRRRRRNNRGYYRTPPTPAQHSRTDSEPPQAFHSPLMTPPASSSSKTTPSTPPPLRLSDRRYLPAPPPRTTTTPPHTPPAESTTASEGSVTASPHAAVPFPRTPTCVPTAGRLVPRHERRATPTITKSSIRFGAPSISTSPIPETATLPAGRQRSNPVGVAPAFSEAAASSASSLYPSRPPRPNCGPALEIPDLVSPAGPPPTWALPRPPAASSPSSVGSVTSQAPTPPHRLHPHAPLPLVTPPPPVAAMSSPLSPILSVSALSSPRSPSSPTRSPLLSGTPAGSTLPPPPPPPTSYSVPSQKHEEVAGVVLPSQLRDHHMSRESVQHDTHESWGSWSGPGDRKRRFTNKNSSIGHKDSKKDGRDSQVNGLSGVTMKRLDLEKLGGSY
ncbi:hypothetical protein PG994_001537 [Apiospora phragmitis]|uniref:Uncharacterized protein n=1 Tax=Apiospora phragmitis TaxID=2905665 RepID=A0ABR1WTY5_9PEZI